MRTVEIMVKDRIPDAVPYRKVVRCTYSASGNLCVHKAHDGWWWKITHVGTGYGLPRAFDRRRDAVAAMRALDHLGWKFDTPDAPAFKAIGRKAAEILEALEPA